MQKKLNVKIYKSGSSNNNITDMVANYNDGKTEFSPRDLEGWFEVEKAYLPSTRRNHCLVKDKEEPNTYHISEDGGKTFTLSIEWVEVFEIKKPEEVLASIPGLAEEMQQELNGSNDDLKNVL